MVLVLAQLADISVNCIFALVQICWNMPNDAGIVTIHFTDCRRFYNRTFPIFKINCRSFCTCACILPGRLHPDRIFPFFLNFFRNVCSKCCRWMTTGERQYIHLYNLWLDGTEWSYRAETSLRSISLIRLGLWDFWDSGD